MSMVAGGHSAVIIPTGPDDAIYTEAISAGVLASLGLNAVTIVHYTRQVYLRIT